MEHEDDLSEEAKEQFDFHDEIRSAFDMAVPIILENQRLTPVGRQLFIKSTEQNYRTCKKVLNYAATHQISKDIGRVFVLCGASRTGSTLLYNLLACDPKSRAPSVLDMTHPIPPVSRSDTVGQQQRKRLAMASSGEKVEMSDYERERNASHPSFEYEEDVLILHQAGFFMPFLESLQSTKLSDWFYGQTNKDFIYKYHKIFLQMLNSVDAPETHWILKSPHHIYNLETFLRHYPSASLVMTHRSLEEVVPSSIRLGLSFASIYFDKNREDTLVDQQMIVDRRLQMTDAQINRIVEFRRHHSDIPVLDIYYDDLVNKPIDTLRKFYDHFKLEWSQPFEDAVIQWLQDNPQGKQGRNTYTLQQFQLTPEQIRQRYEQYNQMFF